MTSSVCGGGVGQYRANVIGRLGKGVAMNKLRTLADVLRQAGFARITGLFLVFYLLCSTAVWLSEPTTLTFGDGRDAGCPRYHRRFERHQHLLHRHAHGRGGELLQHAHQDAPKGHHGALYG